MTENSTSDQPNAESPRSDEQRREDAEKQMAKRDANLNPLKLDFDQRSECERDMYLEALRDILELTESHGAEGMITNSIECAQKVIKQVRDGDLYVRNPETGRKHRVRRLEDY
jgi:hypothetical protein